MNLYMKGPDEGPRMKRFRRLSEYYRPAKGYWTVMTGVPTHGKSAVLDNIMVELAKEHGWHFIVWTPENEPMMEYLINLVKIWTGTGKPEPMLMKETLFEIDKHLTLLNPSDDHRNINYLIEVARCIHKERNGKVDGFIIDPWAELEGSRAHYQTETEFISECLGKIRVFSRECNVHSWLVAHPVKMQRSEDHSIVTKPTLYSISGSAHFRNRCDFGIVVYRDIYKLGSPTEIIISKVRHRNRGKMGTVKLIYDLDSGRFRSE